MAIRKFIVLNGDEHEIAADSDQIPATAIPLSSMAGNMLRVESDALYAATFISAEAGQALQVKADGLYVSTTPDIEISKASNQLLTTKADGLYVDGSGIPRLTRRTIQHGVVLQIARYPGEGIQRLYIMGSAVSAINQLDIDWSSHPFANKAFLAQSSSSVLVTKATETGAQLSITETGAFLARFEGQF